MKLLANELILTFSTTKSQRKVSLLKSVKIS